MSIIHNFAIPQYSELGEFIWLINELEKLWWDQSLLFWQWNENVLFLNHSKERKCCLYSTNINFTHCSVHVGIPNIFVHGTFNPLGPNWMSKVSHNIILSMQRQLYLRFALVTTCLKLKLLGILIHGFK